MLQKNIKKINRCLGSGQVLWYDLSNGKGTFDLVNGMLGVCMVRVTYSSSQRISKIIIKFSGCAGS